LKGNHYEKLVGQKVIVGKFSKRKFSSSNSKITSTNEEKMKRLIKNIGIATLLIVLVMVVIPAYAQGPVPPISPEAQKEKARLLAEYDKALEFELQHGQTIIDPEDGKTKMLTGKSAEKMDLLWQETVKKIEAVKARPASERAPVVEMIETIDEGKPIYVERFTSPYNPSRPLELYQTDQYLYTVDIVSSQIVDISSVVDTSVPHQHSQNDERLKGSYTRLDLEQKARSYINSIASDVNLDSLRSAFRDKEGRVYFFRWEDDSRTLADGSKPFIQVVYSSATGEFIRYANTLPLATAQTQSTLQQFGFLPLDAKAFFNEVYANGGSYWAWVQNGSYKYTVTNDGYCYYAGSWCTPKNYYWGWTDATTSPNTPLMIGKWTPNSSAEYSKTRAWIPCNNATAWSYYKGWVNSGANAVQAYVDQEIYCSEWAPVFGYFQRYTKVQLYNNADIANYKTAWDELWICACEY